MTDGATRSRAAVVIEFPEPHLDGFPTEREDWVQGITEAAMNGVRAWMHGAGLTTELIVHYKEADHG